MGVFGIKRRWVDGPIWKNGGHVCLYKCTHGRCISSVEADVCTVCEFRVYYMPLPLNATPSSRYTHPSSIYRVLDLIWEIRKDEWTRKKEKRETLKTEGRKESRLVVMTTANHALLFESQPAAPCEIQSNRLICPLPHTSYRAIETQRQAQTSSASLTSAKGTNGTRGDDDGIGRYRRKMKKSTQMLRRTK